ncbi:uncharacterized protein LOC129584918 [Paramacrobiotus metropolitanus]|uniref:uncharacterized protein LOC129584918 n=1 Tax=Paramacrobiotus metropolitanus TaxID=2943436 RepID=UPI002445BF5E|nr:uncharacterized protein LOC129584918 [Paramacrobiotus metropolitanus]XP_055333323.1 uncharacterized protein LOC129584918 [Paramacrobiotus metropolitanus]
MGGRRCSAFACPNVRPSNQSTISCVRTFHKFPDPRHDAYRRSLWIAFMRRGPSGKPSTYSYLCSDHFLKDCSEEGCTERLRLKSTAVPTIAPGHAALQPAGILGVEPNSNFANHSPLLDSSKEFKPLVLRRGKRLLHATSDAQRSKKSSNSDEVDDYISEDASTGETGRKDVCTQKPEIECKVVARTVEDLFDYTRLESNLDLVRLPPFWNACVLEKGSTVVFLRLDPDTFETLFTVAVSARLEIKILVRNRPYTPGDFSVRKVVSFQTIADLAFALETSTLCPLSETKLTNSHCDLAYRGKKVNCPSCKRFCQLHAAAQEYGA